ncbi:hypothetical protein [Streptomyces sp. NPDC049916]|uniref:hypothetical protein n=1 Tax=Streptomyces sp. NPDC049916 TaxID=3155156 RepID=UPI00342F81E2
MRLRTAAASAALFLCAALGAVACSSSPDTTRPAAPTAPTAPADGPAGSSRTGERRTAGPAELNEQTAEVNEQSVADPEACATSAAEIPAACALDLTFADVSEGERATEPPTLP